MINKNVPLMPKEYKGELVKNGGYTISTPRKWTDEEIKWALSLREQGYTLSQIAESCGRNETSVQIKLKRLSKSANYYNSAHVKEKYELNDHFIQYIKPKTICDPYCGTYSFYKKYGFGDNAITNDIDKSVKANYNIDALRFLCMCYYNNMKFDLIDLDPFGSAYDCFDLAIKMAKKGLVVTLGELGHKRWRRLDYVKRYYGINEMSEFTIENLISHIQSIGLRNKKELEVWQYKTWQHIGRVYFIIHDVKITEQWDKLNNIGGGAMNNDE